MALGKRFFCLLVPIILTVLSAICMILVAQGGVNSKATSSTNFYFMMVSERRSDSLECRAI